MFDGQDFMADGLCERVQELCRPVFAFLHGVADHELTRFAERVSVKPGASPKLAAHIDGNRRGSYQAVICLSVTSFLVFPYSHKAEFLPRTSKYYQLSRDEITRLGSELCSFETCVPANVGDVLFFWVAILCMVLLLFVRTIPLVMLLMRNSGRLHTLNLLTHLTM